jgi:hypothetical protein
MIATLGLMVWLTVLTVFIGIFGNEILEANRGLNEMQKELDELREFFMSQQGD